MNLKNLFKVICTICSLFAIIACLSGCVFIPKLPFKQAESTESTTVGSKETYRVAVRFITISPDNRDSDHSWDEAKLTAEFILAELKRSKDNEDNIISIMDYYGSSQGGGKLHSVEKGQLVEEINDWCFSPERQRGDMDIIENVYGYTIIYFSGKITD